MKIIKKYWYILFFLIFIALAIGVVNNLFVSLDEFVYYTISKLNCEFTTNFFKSITFLASPVFLVIACIIALIILKNRHNRLYFLITMIVSEVTNLIIKNIVGRSRPIFPHLVEETSFSFPSGHAMGATTFYGLLIYFVWQSNLSKKIKILITILLSLLIILICSSRVYLGVHYFTDVFAGLILSIGIIGLSIMIKNDIK